MGTKVDVVYSGRQSSFSERKKYSFENPSYFKENPSEVLRELIPRYNISKFNSIGPNDLSMFMLPIISLRKGIKSGNSLYINGLSIQDFSQEGLDFSKSIFDFDYRNQDFKLIERKMDLDIEKAIRNLVESYLISAKIIDPGSATKGLVHKTVHKMAKQKAVNYLNERKKRKNRDPQKEKNLEDTLLYGKAVLGNNFDSKYLEMIAEELASQIPEETEPTNVNYATLKPSTGFPFGGRKLKS